MSYNLTLQTADAVIQLPYEVIKSRRRSLSIEVRPGGILIVRAPAFASILQIQGFLNRKQDWILKNYQKQLTNLPAADIQENPALVKRYRDAAAEYFPKRAAYYQPLTGGSFKRITIRDQKTRWGSCSSNGTLSFNWRLMLAPPRVLDYVVVHELCHLTYMNHSPAFWALVAQIMPQYQEYRLWLKNNGSTLRLS